MKEILCLRWLPSPCRNRCKHCSTDYKMGPMTCLQPTGMHSAHHSKWLPLRCAAIIGGCDAFDRKYLPLFELSLRFSLFPLRRVFWLFSSEAHSFSLINLTSKWRSLAVTSEALVRSSLAIDRFRFFNCVLRHVSHRPMPRMKLNLMFAANASDRRKTIGKTDLV